MKLFELIPTAYAQNAGNRFDLGSFNFLNPFSGTDAGGQISTVLSGIITFVLTIAAIVAFFYLVVSGFQYITAGGDAAKAQTARQGIVNALIGIVIILVSYIILRYVGTLFETGGGGGVVGFIQQLT